MLLENLKKFKDSPMNTAIIAGTLCLVCAFVVSLAASSLKSIQDSNIALDRKKNLLAVTKFPAEAMANSDAIKSNFKDNFEVMIIDMETGEEAWEACRDALKSIGKKWETREEVIENYDQFTISKTKRSEVADKIEGDDPANVKYREKFSHVYILKNDDGTPKTYVFPIRGYGLWSMMRGYLGVKPDFQTVEGLVFYDQAETPGLGGEVKSQRFKDAWPGKQLYAESGDVQIRMIKNAPQDDHSIDALSGATITSNGVTNAMEYWMGPQGFKNYIDRQKGDAPEAGEEKSETSAADKAETGVRNG